MWGLYLNGELMAEYNSYAEALDDLFHSYTQSFLMHELKKIK